MLYGNEFTDIPTQAFTILAHSCGWFALISTVVSVVLIAKHMKHLNDTLIQRKIMVIVWMIPVYSVTSWLSIVYVKHSLYFSLLRDCYESLVIYMFFALCYCYIGKSPLYRDVVDLERIYACLRKAKPVHHPWPLNRMMAPIDLVNNPEGFLRRCKVCILQFVIVKPLTALVAYGMATFSYAYEEGDFSYKGGYLYICLIVNTSISISLYWLAIFYLAARDALAPHHPMPKFLCIKGVVFFSYWQSVVIAILVRLGIIVDVPLIDYSATNVAAAFQNALICFEMLGFAFLHHRAFSYKPFVDTEHSPRRVTALQVIAQSWNARDVIMDFNEISRSVLLPSRFRPSSTHIERPLLPRNLSQSANSQTGTNAERTDAEAQLSRAPNADTRAFERIHIPSSPDAFYQVQAASRTNSNTPNQSAVEIHAPKADS